MRLYARAGRPQEAQWLLGRLGTTCMSITPGFRSIGAFWEETNACAGMVGYDLWAGGDPTAGDSGSVVCFIALDHPMAMRALLPHVFKYPFVDCGARALLASVAEVNKKSRALVENLGFRLLATVPGGFAPDGGDLLFYSMRRADCRWLTDEERRRV